MFKFTELITELVQSFAIVLVKVFAPKLYEKYNLSQHEIKRSKKGNPTKGKD